MELRGAKVDDSCRFLSFVEQKLTTAIGFEHFGAGRRLARGRISFGKVVQVEVAIHATRRETVA